MSEVIEQVEQSIEDQLYAYFIETSKDKDPTKARELVDKVTKIFDRMNFELMMVAIVLGPKMWAKVRLSFMKKMDQELGDMFRQQETRRERSPFA